MPRGPQGQQRQWHAVDVGQEHAHPGGVALGRAGFFRKQTLELLCQQFGSDHEPAIGQWLEGDVFEDLPSGEGLGGFGDGFQDILGPEVHFGLKLLVNHRVAQPAGDAGSCHGVGLVRQVWGALYRAEVGRDLRKPAGPARMPHRRYSNRIAQITGDDLRLRFVNEEASAVEELHHPGGSR